MSNWHDIDDPMFPHYLNEIIYNEEDKKRRQQHEDFTDRNENNDQRQQRNDDFDDDDANEESGRGASGRGNQELNDDDEDFDDEDDFDSDDENDSGGSCRPVNLTSGKPVVSSPAPATGFVALALVTAILNGKLDEIFSLLKDNPNWVTAKDGKGLTPLHYAVAVDNLEVVKLLVDRWAIFNVKNNAGFTPLDVVRTRKSMAIVEYFENIDATAQPLFEAIKNVNLNGVRYFLHYYPHWSNVKDNNGMTPLHWGTHKGNIEIMQYLINSGANVNNKDGDGMTPLHWASGNGDFEIVKFLVSKRANINVTDNKGSTVLHYAATGGNIDVVKYLISQGFDFNVKDNKGETPLDWAVQHNDEEDGEDEEVAGVIEYLKSLGTGVQVLFDAIENEQVDEVRTLLENNPQWITARDQDGKTPLHYAVLANDIPIVLNLIKYGIDVNAKDNSALSPLHLAIRDCRGQIAMNLIEFGADVNIKFDYSDTLLHYAAWTGDNDAVKYLVSHGADVNAKNFDGDTPLDVAKTKKRDDVIKYLTSTISNLTDHDDNDENRENNANVLYESGTNVKAIQYDFCYYVKSDCRYKFDPEYWYDDDYHVNNWEKPREPHEIRKLRWSDLCPKCRKRKPSEEYFPLCSACYNKQNKNIKTELVQQNDSNVETNQTSQQFFVTSDTVSTVKTETFLGIPLWTWSGWDSLGHQDILFYGVKWLFESMKQFDGRNVALHRDGHTIGNISISNDTNNGEEGEWQNVSLLKIPEFRQALMAKTTELNPPTQEQHHV